MFSSCGYEPIYSKNISTNKELLSISVKNIKDRPGQILKNFLLNQLNPDRERAIIKYRLAIKITEGKSDLAYRKDMSATRTDLEITVKYSLDDIKKGETIFQQESISISSFDIVESVYANLIAERDAREKSLKVISDDIYTNLIIFFKNK